MKLSVHYTPKMLANADSYSPSAGKPAAGNGFLGRVWDCR
jgi:hypothetical protein